MELEAANLVVMQAARQHDNGMNRGAAANAAKYSAGEVPASTPASRR